MAVYNLGTEKLRKEQVSQVYEQLNDKISICSPFAESNLSEIERSARAKTLWDTDPPGQDLETVFICNSTEYKLIYNLTQFITALAYTRKAVRNDKKNETFILIIWDEEKQEMVML